MAFRLIVACALLATVFGEYYFISHKVVSSTN